MTMQPQAMPQSVLDTIVVDPAEDEEDMREVAQEKSDELEAVLQDIIDNGALIFGKQKPRARLAYFMQVTVAEDLQWVMNPDYMKGMNAGLFPPPVSPLWLSLSMLPDLCWNHFARDFRDLLKDHPAEALQVWLEMETVRMQEMMA